MTVFSEEILLRKEFNTDPGIATTPSTSTFAGIFISIPMSRFVELINKPSLVAFKRIHLRMGNDAFLLVIFSAFETASASLSLMHSIFMLY